MLKSDEYLCVHLLTRQGFSQREIAKIMGRSRETIRNAIRFPRRKKGRKPRPSSVELRDKMKALLKKTVVKGGLRRPAFSSVSELARALHIKPSKCRYHMKAMGWVFRVRPKVTSRHADEIRKKRDFARRELRLSEAKRKGVIFSDEVWLSNRDSEGAPSGQWIPKGQAGRRMLLPREAKARWNAKSVQVWAAIGKGWRSRVVFFPKSVDPNTGRVWRMNSQRYIRMCLSPVKTHLLTTPHARLYQDGASCHTGATAYIHRQGIPVVRGVPANSPEFNQIEPLWRYWKRMIYEEAPTTDQELKKAALKTWAAIPQAVIDKHVEHYTAALQKGLGQ